MQALILAGGKGTRLRPLTIYTPKPIVPFVNRPFLHYQLVLLKNLGITDVVLSLSYMPDRIEDVLGNGSKYGLSIRYIAEPKPMGTAGAYKFASAEFAETTIVLNGDILTDVNLADVVARHKANDAEATIALAHVDDPSKYGLVQTDDNQNVVQFLEKPAAETLAALNIDTINAGIYILEPSILSLIPENEPCSFEYDVFPKILEMEKRFSAFILRREDYWRDIGTPQSYLSGHQDFLNRKVRGFDDEIDVLSDIATMAIIDEKSFIGDDCVVKAGAQISSSIIGNGVVVEEKAVIENSVIWANSSIASHAHVSDSFVGRGCYIGRGASLSNGTILGDKSTVTDYTKL